MKVSTKLATIAIAASMMFTGVAAGLPMLSNQFSSVVATSEAELNVGDFVNRCYQVALGRDADEAGYKYWIDNLNNGVACGAQVGYGFIFSEEYTKKNTTNDQFVKDLYQMYFDRTPDADGYKYWVDMLNAGSSRETVFAGFANSLEFFNLCVKYNVVSGVYVEGIPTEQQGGVNSFVARLYQVCFNRLPDMAGQGGWTLKLINKEMTGSSVAEGFVFSQEMTNQNLSNEEFVKCMYQAFFGRPADEAGLKAWTEKLDAGASKNEIFYGFAASVEFDALCASYGIVRGEPTPPTVAPTAAPTRSPNPNPTVIPYEGEIIDMTMFSAMPGNEINSNNDIQEMIAELTGVRVKEHWLTGGQTAWEAVSSILASGNLPDFIDGVDGMDLLYDAGVLVAWDPYLEKYPNLKELYTDAEWELFRQDDGHIYWADVFNNTYGEARDTIHNDGAFWIQVRVLEWAGYPQIDTLDQYFTLIEAYIAANPTMPDGTKNVGYTALCDDWRYFCIESPGQFLAGYPNDGSVIVNTTGYSKPTIEDYNTSNVTHDYLMALNSAYKAGVVDPYFATRTYDQYISLMSTGAVLGMFDQYWDFAYSISGPFMSNGLSDIGCDYVPLGITAPGVTRNQWHNYSDAVNNYSGIAVTTSCKDPDVAFRFLSNLLTQEVHDLRFWGIEGVDYLVDSDGLYYRTEQMRRNWKTDTYQANHCCTYSYMPQWLGTSRDGINAMMPYEQTSEYYATLPTPVAECLKAYRANSIVDMLHSDRNVEYGPWYPMYSFSNAMTYETPGGVAYVKITDIKHEWIPKVVMATDFEAAWKSYMQAYAGAHPEDFIGEMQEELDRRIAYSN